MSTEPRTTTPAVRAVVTREPEHRGEDYHLLVDGVRIGGTYWSSGQSIKNGARWASYGPAGLQMGWRTREDAEQAQVDVHLSNRAARAADRAVADAFCGQLRELLTLAPDTPRFHQGHDQHLRADRLIRLAHERVQDQAALQGDDILASGVTAARAWHRFIYQELATDTVLEYVQNLSPWEFCQFLGELAVADVRTGRNQDRYFCDLATRIANGPAGTDPDSITLRSQPAENVHPEV
ncbi:hypothetical protein [Streptomyces flavofungini]|uniref:hypothetical protein n=1 Tax=Streptomyces flavofungini TaxID=68200 RepID=UPI0025B10093|nr:hypothetical protein [Streptomyces flavofungini]WJV51750.1 hypothetical protein QUY26_39675 [Streptomyces flavofungini]